MQVFCRDVLPVLDLNQIVDWARSELKGTNRIGTIYSADNYPKALAVYRPRVLQLVSDTQTGDHFLLLAFKFGLEREGLMIGATNSRVNNYGYRYPLTAGVFYVFDRN